MKRYLLAIITVIVIVLLQTSFFVEFFGPEKNPILILSLALAILMLNRRDLSLFASFSGGLLIDSTGDNFLGFSSLFFVTLILSAEFVRKFLIKNYTSQALVAIIGVMLYSVLSVYPGDISLQKSLGCAMLTTLFMFIFYFIGRYLKNEKIAF